MQAYSSVWLCCCKPNTRGIVNPHLIYLPILHRVLWWLLLLAWVLVFLLLQNHLCCYSYRTNNSITHFITHTQPLSTILQNLYHQAFSSLTFPSCLNGLQLSQSIITPEHYDPLPLIPSFFWRSKYPGFLPLYSKSRSLLCHELFDLNHPNYCTNTDFHSAPGDDCICVDCDDLATAYHQYFCSEKQ